MLVEVDDVQERGEVMAPLPWEGGHTEWGIIFLDGVGRGSTSSQPEEFGNRYGTISFKGRKKDGCKYSGEGSAGWWVVWVGTLEAAGVPLTATTFFQIRRTRMVSWDSVSSRLESFYFPFAFQFYFRPGLQCFGNLTYQLETLLTDVSKADGLYVWRV